LFAACSVADEVREVLRRAVAQGLRWDEVEVVAADAMAYGAAVDSLARRLDIPVTYASGLPIRRTRPGRAVDAYLRWVRDDFAEDVLRGALERGDVAPPRGGHGTSGPALARRLRRLSIGRGRERYLAALDRSRTRPEPALELDEDESADDVTAAADRDRRALDDLASIVEPVLRATPALPARIEPTAAVVAPAALAKGLLVWLSLVPAGAGDGDGSSPRRGTASLDATAKARLVTRLERLAAVALRATTLDAAISIVASKMDTRVPAPAAGGAAPWSSAGGFLHVADVEHGGQTGRRATFVVGLDAMRFPGGAPHETLLGDEERRRLRTDSGFAPIPTSGERLQERRWHLARLLSRLRGSVTLSYSAWEATEARAVAPAAEMLQAFRLSQKDRTANYEAMHDALAVRASAVPRSGGRLDAADVWLGALARGSVLLRGTDVVRDAFPGLAAGLAAAESRAAAAFTAHHGRIEPRPGLDPRDNPDLVLSARRLETLGTCPLRYFLRYVLHAVPPDTVEWAADRWLTPLGRGRLLHRVYERTLREVRARGQDITSPGFEPIALKMLDVALTRERVESPPPGDAVYAVEVDMLREDVIAFVRMTRVLGAPWEHLEQSFGRSAAGKGAVRIKLRAGEILVSGAIDRIDRHDEGFVVIDYKTGSAGRFGRPQAVFHGGRRLQHALYSAVTRELFGNVVRAEYHFPTHRGETRVERFEERELRRARRILDALLDLTATGHFHPTNDAEDCRHCDYRRICRVREQPGGIQSPMAKWARQTDAPELWVMRRLRDPMV
jgi:RecB family exonuclease